MSKTELLPRFVRFVSGCVLADDERCCQEVPRPAVSSVRVSVADWISASWLKSKGRPTWHW